MINQNISIVLAHFNQDNQLSKETQYYIEKLAEISFLDQFILVSTSAFQDKEREYLEGLGIKLFERDNIGYDFYSYKVGIEHLDILSCDNLLICNDSIFGPLFDIEPILKEMVSNHADIVGMTHGFKHHYHLQSYFVLFKPKVVQSMAFKAFWDGVKILEDKKKIIRNYEIGMSQYFLDKGFHLGVYANFIPNIADLLFKSNKPLAVIKQLIKVLIRLNPSSIKGINQTHYFWQMLIETFHVPFIKKELVYKNPENINISNIEKFLSNIKYKK
ncbi:MAG: hypothetical protein JXQ76_03775 [Campylobacterales bacterium]|nr:hypothetical protein [Campylobacterales bacterium]